MKPRRAGAVAILLGCALLFGTGAPIARAQDASETPGALMGRAADRERSENATQLEEACALYLRLLEKFPKDALAPRARLDLGLCLARLGRTEEARARMREARATGKDDPALCHDAEQALMALPPEPEKPAPAPSAPAHPTARPEAAPVGSTAPAPAAKPAPPADDERAKLVKRIEELDARKRSLIDQVHQLEDAGRTEEAYGLRAQVDAIANDMDRLKHELRALAQRSKARPAAPAPGPKKGDAALDDAAKQRLLLALKRDKLESTARLAEQRAQELRAAGKLDEARAAQQEAAKAHAEAAQVAEQLKKLTPAAAPAPDPREAALRQDLEKARAALKAAEHGTDGPAKDAAREKVKAAEEALQGYEAEREARNEKTGLDRLADQMRKRGAPQWELDERLALARREIELEHAYRKKTRELRRDLKQKGAPEGEVKTEVAALEKTKRDEVDKLRAETEERILARAKVELEAELQRRGADLRAEGLSAHEIDVRLAEARRELEAKLPGHRPEKRAAETSEKERERALREENARLHRRVDELERELAALKTRLAKAEADLGPPSSGPPAAQTTVPPGR